MDEHSGWSQARRRLVQGLRRQGIADERVLAAIERVPRHLFVPEQHLAQAYDDVALPIACGQTISQPLVVAVVAEALQLYGGECVLEVGTGSGYQAAVLAQLSARVITLERETALAAAARERLASLGYSEVEVHVADGSLGWPAAAPYRAIAVAAAAPGPPRALLDQLDEGGRLVIPIGSAQRQTLRAIVKAGAEFLSTGLGPVRFVPLIGSQGWPEQTTPGSPEASG